MSGQFNKSNFEQNPSKMKKKRNTKEWVTNNDSSLCDAELLSEDDIKAIKDANWKEKHVPKPSKKEEKYRQEINRLESNSVKAPLSKSEEKKLKQLKKKHKKLYDYRHRDLSSNHTGFKCCLMSVALLFVLAFTAVFGGYHLYVQPITGVTLIELGDLIGGLYKVDDNAFPQNYDVVNDGQAFFDNLQKAMYLDSPLNINDLLELIPQSKGGVGSETSSVADLLDKSGDPVPSENNSLTGNEYLDKLLADTKFDFSTLKDFDANSAVPVWEITDKMLAAVMQQVILNIDSVPMVQELVSQYNISIKNSISVAQCNIKKNANGESTISVILKVKINTLVKEILSSFDFQGFDFLKNLIPSLLPKSIYITANTTPEVDKAPTLGINSIKEETIQKILYTADSKYVNGTIEKTLNSVGKSIFSTINSINEMTQKQGIVIVPSTEETANGEIKLDLLTTALRQMNVTNVTSTDFLLMVKHMHTVDFDYADINSYINANVTNPTSKEAFSNSVTSLFATYGIDEKFCKDITPDNFLDKIETIPEHINIKSKFEDDYIYNYTNDQLAEKAKLSDAALAQIINTTIGEKLGEEFKMEILELTLTEKTIDMIAYIDIASIIKTQVGNQLGALEPLIMSIFPKNVYIKVIVPMDKNGELKTDIIFNYTKDESSDNKSDSDKMFETIEKLIAGLTADKEDGSNNSVGGIGNDTLSKFTKENLINKLNSAIYPALETIVPPTGEEPEDMHIGFTKGGLQLPTIYEILANVLNEGETETANKMSAEVIQNTMAGYYNYDEETKFDKNNGQIINKLDTTYLTGETGFIKRELNGKFFYKNNIASTDVFKTLKELGSNITAGNLANTFDLARIKANMNDATDGNFAITALELAKLIEQSGNLSTIKDIGFYKNFKFVDMSVDETKNTLSLRMAGTLDKNAQGIAGIKLENFAADYLVVSAIISLNDYSTTIKINAADDGQIDNLLKLINKIIKTDGAGADFDKTTVANNIGETIKTSFEDFANQGIALVATDEAVKIPVNGETNGFTSTNLYQLISKNISGDNYQEGDTGETLRSVIYKLNNLPKKDGGEYSYTSVTMNPLTGSDGKFDVTNSEGATQTKFLYETLENTDNTFSIKIYDGYIGQQIKKAVDNATTKLTKFGLFCNNSIGEANSVSDFRNVVADLGLVDFSDADTSKDIVPRNLIETAPNGLLFMHFEMSNSLIGGNDLANVILPEKIYGGTFVVLNNGMADLTSATKYTFINNLNTDETTYLNNLMTPPTTGGDGSEGGDGGSGSEPENPGPVDPDGGDSGDSGESTPTTRTTQINVKSALDAMVDLILSDAVRFSINLETDQYIYAPTALQNIKLADLLANRFSLADANVEGFEMQLYCYGVFVNNAVPASDIQIKPQTDDTTYDISIL